MSQVLIHPSVEGDQRLNRKAVYAYIGASTLGGATIGGLLGGVGRAAATMLVPFGGEGRLLIASVLLLVSWTALRDRGVRFQIRRQVPRQWTRQSPVRMAIGFGVLLGLGYVTFLAVPAMYVLAIGLALVGSHSLIAAVSIGCVYGFARAATVVRVRWAVRKVAPNERMSGPNLVVIESLSLARRWRSRTNNAAAAVAFVSAVAIALGA